MKIVESLRLGVKDWKGAALRENWIRTRKVKWKKFIHYHQEMNRATKMGRFESIPGDTVPLHDWKISYLLLLIS